MSDQNPNSAEREAARVVRIPLSDDWLRWDPERIHRYPDLEVADLEDDVVEPVPGARVPRARHPAAEIPYYLILGFSVGLVCGGVFLGLAYVLGP